MILGHLWRVERPTLTSTPLSSAWSSRKARTPFILFVSLLSEQEKAHIRRAFRVKRLLGGSKARRPGLNDASDNPAVRYLHSNNRENVTKIDTLPYCCTTARALMPHNNYYYAIHQSIITTMRTVIRQRGIPIGTLLYS